MSHTSPSPITHPRQKARRYHNHGRHSAAIRCRYGRSYHQIASIEAIGHCGWDLHGWSAEIYQSWVHLLCRLVISSSKFQSLGDGDSRACYRTAIIVWGDASRQECLFYIIHIITLWSDDEAEACNDWHSGRQCWLYSILCSTCLFYLCDDFTTKNVDLRP